MRRLLFVVPLHSPHAARWVSQLANTEWDVHLFGTGSNINPLFFGQNITVHTVWPLKSSQGIRNRVHRDLWPFFLRGRGTIKSTLPMIARFVMKELSERLADIITDLQPSIVHSLKMDSSRLVYDAFQYLAPNARPKWVYSIWGRGDILAEDQPIEKTQALLQAVDYLMADNPRDLQIATEYGFTGQVLGVFPTGGGYPLHIMRRNLTNVPSKRRTIALKGYQAPESGQAITALEAIGMCKEHLQGYRLVIHSAKATHAFENFEVVKSKAIAVAKACDISVEILPYSPIETIWNLFCQSRVSLAISVSDGTPNTLLEAMAVGAFPIQSNTGGLEQWVDSGKNGFLVPFDDPCAIADALRNGITNDGLVDSAAQINQQLTNERLEWGIVTRKVLDIYEHIAMTTHE